MAASDSSLLASLRRVSLDDHEGILKAVNDTLKKSKKDPFALHVKAVAFLKLERYKDVVQLVEGAGPELKERAWFEYAYALYRSERPEHAVKVAEAHGGGRGMSHLLAQAVCLCLFRTAGLS